MTHYVYFLWNLDEDVLLYVGRSLDPKDRLRDFIRREGVSAVLGEVWAHEHLEEACAAELSAITDNNPVYNKVLVSSRGRLGRSRPHTGSTRMKMRTSHLGRANSALHCERISKGRKGIKFGPEWCAAISKGLQGFKHTPQACENMAAARRGKPRGPYKKKSTSKGESKFASS